MPFRDRADAGRQLAPRVAALGESRPIVLALPRGGVPVAFEVARAIGAPLDVILVRKLGRPGQPELAMGAIGEGGVRVLNVSVARRVDEREIAEVENRERAELDRRARRYRGDRSPVAIAGRTVIVVDDGLATGSTARAAIAVARARGAERVVLAVPVAPCDVVDTFAAIADAVVAVETPDDMWAIGSWYADFAQTSDADVVRLLERC